jgi:Holliday junction resolvase-like predicted endonuclease
LRNIRPKSIKRNAKGLQPDEEEKGEGKFSDLIVNKQDYKLHAESSVIEDCFIKVKERKKRTNVSFSMKKIDKNKLKEINNLDNSSNKPISIFSCRSDVIYKKILRDFRKYFINKFANFTRIIDFTSVRKRQEREKLLMNFVNAKF